MEDLSGLHLSETRDRTGAKLELYPRLGFVAMKISSTTVLKLPMILDFDTSMVRA
jgi:hypothetical protein